MCIHLILLICFTVCIFYFFILCIYIILVSFCNYLPITCALLLLFMIKYQYFIFQPLYERMSHQEIKNELKTSNIWRRWEFVNTIFYKYKDKSWMFYAITGWWERYEPTLRVVQRRLGHILHQLLPASLWDVQKTSSQTSSQAPGGGHTPATTKPSPPLRGAVWAVTQRLKARISLIQHALKKENMCVDFSDSDFLHEIHSYINVALYY